MASAYIDAYSQVSEKSRSKIPNWLPSPRRGSQKACLRSTTWRKWLMGKHDVQPSSLGMRTGSYDNR
jgi:hypothetical protein